LLQIHAGEEYKQKNNPIESKNNAMETADWKLGSVLTGGNS
jgi:hypothetical protein